MPYRFLKLFFCKENIFWEILAKISRIDEFGQKKVFSIGKQSPNSINGQCQGFTDSSNRYFLLHLTQTFNENLDQSKTNTIYSLT